jgi:DNA ligase-1
LRIGLGEGTLRDALVWAFEGQRLGIGYDAEKNDIVLPDDDRKPYEESSEKYQEAYDLCNDFGRVALVAKAEGISGLARITLVPGTPVKAMLFQKAVDMKEALDTVSVPAAIEYKYDGFRMQIHKAGGKITIFTRRLENVTAQFPDVVKAVEEHVQGESYILDSEAVGIDVKTRKYIAFQNISQRIKRKYDIVELSTKFPVELDIFDALYYDGENLVHEPFSKRREALTAALPKSILGVICLATQEIVETEEAAQTFYQKSLAAGNEGVMLKNLSSVYKPGSRVGYGMKVKPVLETLEVVVVGAEYGEGKRGEWLATFVIAVRDPDSDALLEIGRVGTGFKEKEEEGFSFGQMTGMLRPLVVSEEGRFVHVRPEIIIEVHYEEIQRSPTYSSGYALRFPRFVRLREDRSVEDISTIEDVERYYAAQRGRNT